MTLPFQSKTETTSFLALAAVLAIGMPLADSLGWIDHFTLNVWGKYLCYAILAISVDLLWGYTGLLCLGQGLFFSLGGYMLGMHLMLMIAEHRGGTNSGILPDFMTFLGRATLPSFWKPFQSLPFSMVMVVLLPGLVAFLFGWMAFRSRIKGVYFSILTQALTYAAALMFFQNDLLMGGNNGFTDFRSLAGANLRDPATQRTLYILTALLLCGVYVLCRWLTRTKFGLVQRAVRDSETRVLFSGYPAASYKLFVFTLCAVIAGIAGALYVPQVGIINPSEMTAEKSLEIIVWVAVGGRGTIIGPIIGAVFINALKSWATRAIPDLWPLLLGGMFVIVVLVMPGGIAGLPAQFRSLKDRFFRRTADSAIPAPASGK